jgi:hypothetical protein
MLAWGEVTGKALLTKSLNFSSSFTGKVTKAIDYPWTDLPAGSSICDVGGGNGHVTAMLLNAFPHLKFVLQDLPAVVDQGKEVG